MTWSGGIYTPTNGVYTGGTMWEQSAAAGYDILATQFDAWVVDLTAGLQNCMTVDGLNRASATIPPSVDGTYSLGTPSLRWANLYLTGATFLYSGGNYVQLQAATLTGNRTINMPDSGGQVILDQAPNFNPIGTSSGQGGLIKLFELAANGVNYVGIRAPDNISGNYTWQWPGADGTSGQALITDAAGNLSFGSAGTTFMGIFGGTPGGIGITV